MSLSNVKIECYEDVRYNVQYTLSKPLSDTSKFDVAATFIARTFQTFIHTMWYEHRKKVWSNLTFSQHFTNVVITLCASWDSNIFLQGL